MISIIHPTIQDLPEIVKLCQGELNYPQANIENAQASFESLTSTPHHCLYIAKDHERVVGFIHAHISKVLFMEDFVHILCLVVSNDYQNKGIGRQLLEQAESWTALHNIQKILLNSNVTRHQAHLFYEHCGYHTHKTQKQFIKILHP